MDEARPVEEVEEKAAALVADAEDRLKTLLRFLRGMAGDAPPSFEAHFGDGPREKEEE